MNKTDIYCDLAEGLCWNLAIWKSNLYDLYTIDTSYTNKMGWEAPFAQAIRYSMLPWVAICPNIRLKPTKNLPSYN